LLLRDDTAGPEKLWHQNRFIRLESAATLAKAAPLTRGRRRGEVAASCDRPGTYHGHIGVGQATTPPEFAQVEIKRVPSESVQSERACKTQNCSPVVLSF
jgi:hypothetical protein